MTRTVLLRDLPGLVPYEEARSLQLELVADRKAARRPDTLLLLEHPPVITLGRNADAAGVVAPEDLLRRQGIAVHRIERGGQATYHGPGQVVGYPVLDLRPLGLGVRSYVERLEEVMLRTAAAFGVEASRWEGRQGVFCDAGKLGAVGVAVSRGVTYHGFALNVRPDLAHFRLIVPCGLTDTAITSLAAARPPGPDLPEARAAVAAAFEEVFGVTLEPEDGA